MNKEQFLAPIEAQKKSGKSVTDYCREHNVSMSTYCYWKRKCSISAGTLQPLHISSTLGSTSPISTLGPTSPIGTQGQVSPSGTNHASMRVCFPNGVEVAFDNSRDDVALEMLNQLYSCYVLAQ